MGDDPLSPELEKLKIQCAKFAAMNQKAKFRALLAKERHLLTWLPLADLNAVTLEQAIKDAAREKLTLNGTSHYEGGPAELDRLRADLLGLATELVARPEYTLPLSAAALADMVLIKASRTRNGGDAYFKTVALFLPSGRDTGAQRWVVKPLERDTYPVDMRLEFLQGGIFAQFTCAMQYGLWREDDLMSWEAEGLPPPWVAIDAVVMEQIDLNHDRNLRHLKYAFPERPEGLHGAGGGGDGGRDGKRGGGCLCFRRRRRRRGVEDDLGAGEAELSSTALPGTSAAAAAAAAQAAEGSAGGGGGGRKPGGRPSLQPVKPQAHAGGRADPLPSPSRLGLMGAQRYQPAFNFDSLPEVALDGQTEDSLATMDGGETGGGGGTAEVEVEALDWRVSESGGSSSSSSSGTDGGGEGQDGSDGGFDDDDFRAAAAAIAAADDGGGDSNLDKPDSASPGPSSPATASSSENVQSPPPRTPQLDRGTVSALGGGGGGGGASAPTGWSPVAAALGESQVGRLLVSWFHDGTTNGTVAKTAEAVEKAPEATAAERARDRAGVPTTPAAAPPARAAEALSPFSLADRGSGWFEFKAGWFGGGGDEEEEKEHDRGGEGGSARATAQEVKAKDDKGGGLGTEDDGSFFGIPSFSSPFGGKPSSGKPTSGKESGSGKADGGGGGSRFSTDGAGNVVNDDFLSGLFQLHRAHFGGGEAGAAGAPEAKPAAAAAQSASDARGSSEAATSEKGLAGELEAAAAARGTVAAAVVTTGSGQDDPEAPAEELADFDDSDDDGGGDGSDGGDEFASVLASATARREAIARAMANAAPDRPTSLPIRSALRGGAGVDSQPGRASRSASMPVAFLPVGSPGGKPSFSFAAGAPALRRGRAGSHGSDSDGPASASEGDSPGPASADRLSPGSGGGGGGGGAARPSSLRGGGRGGGSTPRQASSTRSQGGGGEEAPFFPPFQPPALAALPRSVRGLVRCEETAEFKAMAAHFVGHGVAQDAANEATAYLLETLQVKQREGLAGVGFAEMDAAVRQLKASRSAANAAGLRAAWAAAQRVDHGGPSTGSASSDRPRSGHSLGRGKSGVTAESVGMAPAPNSAAERAQRRSSLSDLPSQISGDAAVAAEAALAAHEASLLSPQLRPPKRPPGTLGKSQSKSPGGSPGPSPRPSPGPRGSREFFRDESPVAAGSNAVASSGGDGGGGSFVAGALGAGLPRSRASAGQTAAGARGSADRGSSLSPALSSTVL